MIEGVEVKKLVKYIDERGMIVEFLRRDDEIFQGFGQVYITKCNPGFVKGWHYHKKQTDNFVCVNGKARVVLFDGRDKSKTKGEINEFILCLEDPILVKIPPGVAHGFECVTNEDVLIVNTPTEPYNKDNPDEFRIPFDSENIPYKWHAKKGG